MKISIVILVIVLLTAGCGGTENPREVVLSFMEMVKTGNIDGARELLARDQWDHLEEFCGQDVEITGYVVEDIEIFEEGNRAVVEWNTTIIDENSSDSNEDGEFELTKNDEGWIITDLYPGLRAP